MRIERIAVHRYGPLRDLDIPLRLPAGGGMVVVEGPNEAGKSTLLRFVRALLFGGGAADGALVVEHGGGRYRLEQHGARSTLALTELGSGRPLEPTALRRLVGNLDADVYARVFAFGLTELQAIASLSGQGVQERIFSAAVAGAGRSVREVQRGLAAEIQGLWRPRSASAIRQAAQRLREALQAAREAERAAGEWPRLVLEGEELAARITSIERAIEAGRREVRRNELLLELHERWSERREARERLAAAPGWQPVPDESVRRLATLRPEIDLLRTRLVDLEARLAALEPAAVRSAGLLPLAERIEGVSAAAPLQRQRLEERLPDTLDALRAAEGLLASALAPLGGDWTEARVAAQPFSSLPSAEIDAFADGFADLRRRRIEVESACRMREDAVREAGAEVAARRAAGADLRWLGVEGEVRALHAEAGVHRSRVERLRRLETEVEQGGVNLRAVLGRLGPAWEEGRVLDFASHAQWRRVAAEAVQAAERAADERRKRQVAAESAQAQAAARAADLDLLGPPARTAAEVERAVRAVGAEIACLEDLSGTLQEWHQDRQERQAAESAARAAQAPLRQPLDWWRLALALALPAALAVWLARSAAPAAAALALLAVALGALNWPRRAAPVGGERARADLREVERRLEATDRRLKDLGARAGLAAIDLGSVNRALSTARVREDDLRREWEACRAWQAAADALRQAEQRLGEARAGAEAAERAETETRLQWQRWREANGLPPDLLPVDLPALLAEVDRAAEMAQAARTARAEAASLSAAVADWRRRVEAVAERLGLGRAGPPEEAADALHGQLERAVDLGRAIRAAEEAERRHAEGGRDLAALDQAQGDLGRRWAGWCAERALPTAAPADLKIWLRDARAAAEQVARVRALRAEAAALAGRGAEWEAQAGALLRDAARPGAAGGTALVSTIEALAADLQTARLSAGERDRARSDLAATRAEIEAKEAEVAALLAACGAASEAELAERLQGQADRREWQRIISEADQELARRAGQDAPAIARLLDLDTPLRWREEAERLRAQLPALEAQLNDREGGLRMRLGELRSRRDALERSGDIARARLEAGQRRTVLAEALRRYAVCRLADALIAETLGEYERSHVPEVVRSAGERFARVTGGRYPAVHALEGGQFRVAAGGDAALSAEDLSRGTQEQLYLAVRLGLADSFARQSASLPLVLDDVLVNADPERREGLIRVLVDAARDHQTIVLTCHPETGAAIRRLAPEAQVVALPRLAGPASAAAPPRRGRDAVPDPRLPAIILAALREHAEGLGSGDLCDMLGVGPGELRGLLAPLLESGEVVREGRTRAAKYRLTDSRTA